MNEHRFWSELREELPIGGHYVRVENLTAPGTPDLSYCVAGVEGWMELKYTDRFPLEHPVLRSQSLWIEQRVRSGGRAHICVGYKKLVYFIAPEFAVEINEWLQPDFNDRAIATAIRGSRLDSVAEAFLRTIRPGKTAQLGR